MKALSKKVLRDIKGIWVRVFLIAAIVAVGVSAYSSGYMAKEALEHTKAAYFERLRLADLQLWIDATDPEDLPDFSKIPEIAKVEKRFWTPGYLEKEDGTPLVLALIYMEPKKRYDVNDLQIIEGSSLSPEDETGVVIERTLAEIYNYKVGDEFTINPYNNPKKVKVRGIAINPQFLAPTSYPDVFIPAKGSLGVVFLPMALIAESLSGAMFNDLSFIAAENTSVDKLSDLALKSLEGRAEVNKIITRARQPSEVYVQENINGFAMFIPINVAIFGLIAFLVTFLTVRRLVSAQEVEIGALMALGYPIRRIFTNYLLIGVSIGLISLLLEAIVAKPLTDTIARAYGESIGLPPLVMAYNYKHILIGGAAGFFSSILAVALPLLSVLRLNPQEAIRGVKSSGFAGLPLLLQPIIDALAFGSTTRRFALRNIFRRPGLAASIVVLIASAIAVSASFMISLSSWHQYAETSFLREKWDALVVFRVPLTREEIEPIAQTEGVDKAQLLIVGSGLVRDGEYEREQRLMGIVPPEGLRSIPLREGDLLTAPDADEIILNGNFNSSHTFKAGGKVELEVGGRKRTMTVVGVMNDATVGIAYLPIETARVLLDRGEKYDGMNITFKSGVNPEEMDKRLYAHEMASYVSLKAKMRELVNEFLRIITSVVEISLFISYIFSLLFLLIGLSMTVLERASEYAALRSLGYGRAQIAAIIYYEIAFETGAALLLSIPLTYVIGEYLRKTMGKAWLIIDFEYTPLAFASIILPAALILAIAALPFIYRILKMPLAEALRRRGIE